ncbi:autotransporter domain-containing protein [Paracoccus saliphilus]|nr:autotransporter domain-containing protein [Paracoccus saliphilus]
MLDWRHAFGDTTPLSRHAFSAGDAFTIAGVPIAEDAAVIEAGIDLNLSDTARLGLSYQGQFGSGVQESGLKADLKVRF